MSDIWVELNTEGLMEAMKQDLEGVERDVRQGVKLLAAQAHARIKEQVQAHLHTRRAMYDEALAVPSEVAPGIYVIALDKSATWIEEGMPPHSMVDDLLRKGAKTAADGSRYKVIPFEQKKGPTQSSPAQAALTGAIRTEMKRRGIPYGNIERDADGAAKTGLLHKFNIMDKPERRIAQGATEPGKNNHGWGAGPVGRVMQGPNAQGGSGGGIPLLQGVHVYQTLVNGPDGKPALDKQGRQKAIKSIVTFRVVSSKHRGIKWNYPGIEGSHFFDDAERWVQREWEDRILPEILAKYG